MPDNHTALATVVTDEADENAALTMLLTAVAYGRADLEAGRVVSPEHLDDWIEALVAPLPAPATAG
jgi:hypothetical protein